MKRGVEIRELKKNFALTRWTGFRRTVSEVVAVDGISMDVPEGQAVAFIGPNGAGKSTTIKMLTGILHPTSGSISVLGFTPWRDRRDVMSLWATTTAGFGIAYGLMGNAHRRLAPAIAQGELDLWLLHPRAVLPHFLLGSTIPSAWGDAAFGYVIYFGFVKPNVQQALMFVVLSIVVAVVFVGFGILTGSLSFYLGNASTLSDQWRDISITFATYPPTLFDGKVKLLLFTVIPAGFISYLPVESLRSMSIVDLLIAIAGAFGVLAAGVGVFYFGFRRYESGNLISMNG